MLRFWNARNQWLPSWRRDNGEKTTFVIDYVRVWSLWIQLDAHTFRLFDYSHYFLSLILSTAVDRILLHDDYDARYATFDTAVDITRSREKSTRTIPFPTMVEDYSVACNLFWYPRSSRRGHKIPLFFFISVTQSESFVIGLLVSIKGRTVLREIGKKFRVARSWFYL